MHSGATGLVDCRGGQVGGNNGGNVANPEEDQSRGHEGAAAHAGDTDHDTNEQSSYRCRDLGVMICPESLRKKRGEGGQHVQSPVRQRAVSR